MQPCFSLFLHKNSLHYWKISPLTAPASSEKIKTASFLTTKYNFIFLFTRLIDSAIIKIIRYSRNTFI